MQRGLKRIIPIRHELWQLALSRSAGKSRDLPTGLRFYAFATCGFVAIIRVALGGLQFFRALPEIGRFRGGARKRGMLSLVRLHRTVINVTK